MSGRGIDFLENWGNKNVTVAKRKTGRDRAKELAAFCYAEAATLGITMDDMEPEWGTVEEIIFDALQDVLGDELEQLKILTVMQARREGNDTLH